MKASFKPLLSSQVAIPNWPKQVSGKPNAKMGKYSLPTLVGGTAKPLDKCRVTLYQGENDELRII